MSREELEKWNCEGLAKYCKENNIPHFHGKNRFRKSEMIEAILETQGAVIQDELPTEDKGVDSVGIVKEAANIKQLPGTLDYIKTISVGTLVAFKENSGRLNTAAVQNVSFKRNQLKLVTRYGKEFIVSFDDVIWVRTSERWPRFVLDILKSQQRERQQHVINRQKG